MSDYIYERIAQQKNASVAAGSDLDFVVGVFMDTQEGREGMINSPDGPIHLLRHCLDVFDDVFWDDQRLINELPIDWLERANPVIAQYISEPETKISNFPKKLLERQFKLSGECPHLAGYLRKSETQSIGRVPLDLAYIIGSNPVQGLRLLEQQGMGAMHMLNDQHGHFLHFAPGLKGPMELSLMSSLYCAMSEDRSTQTCFEIMLASNLDGQCIHARRGTKELTLVDIIKLVNKHVLDFKGESLPNYETQFAADKANRAAKDAIKDILKDVKPKHKV